MKLEFTVNGERREVEVDPLRRLLDVLRDDLHLTGTKEGCGEGECGACTVLVDGEAVNSCLVACGQVEACAVTTVESDALASVRQAFLECGGAQCGICTPGMIVATRAFVDASVAGGKVPTEHDARTALAGNLCRCTGYGTIVASALKAADTGRRDAADGGEVSA